MNFNEVVIGVVSTIFGGGLASYLTFKIGLKKQGLSEFERLISEYKILRESLQTRVDSLENDIERLREVNVHQREEIVTLRHQLQLFESSHVDIPLAMWLKDINGKMLFVNSQYEEQFLLPRGYNSNDYIGYKDHAVWSKEVADDFAKNDMKVVRYKKPIKSIERLDGGKGDITYCEILKYPRTINNKVIGISGIVLRTADSKEDLE